MADRDEIANKIGEIYFQAQNEIKQEFDRFTEHSKAKLKDLHDDIKNAKTPEEKRAAKKRYQNYLSYCTLQNERYNDLLDQCTKTLVNADKVALDYINGKLPDAYIGQYDALNNAASAMLNRSFAVINAEAVRALIMDDRSLLPYKELDPDVDKEWNWKHIHNAVTQAVIQGDSVPELAERLQGVVEMDRRAAMRNARTMINGAENRGRFDAQKNLKDQGVILYKEWSTTRDGRERDSHRNMNGEITNQEGPFSNGLMYPGDPAGEPAEVYNCRCRLKTVIKGFEKVKI